MADNSENRIFNVPHLRFPEFNGEWETKSINDLADVISGDTPDTTVKSYWDGGIQWSTPSEIGKNKFVDVDLYTITENGLNNSSAELLPPNAILLSSRATIEECSLSLGECATSQSPRSLVSRKCNVDFLYYLVQAKKKDLIRKSYGSTFLETSANEAHRIQASIPSDVEQQKIAGLLSLIDKRIATQNKITEDLKKLKSAIVKTLLCNQSGELFKLRGVGCFVRGLTYASEDVTGNKTATTVIWANNLNYSNDVDKDEVAYVNKILTTGQILREDDTVICMANGPSSLVGKNSYYPFNDGQFTIGALYGIYRASYPFVEWLTQSQRYKRLVYQSLQGRGGAIANLNSDDILNTSLLLIGNGKSQSIIFTIDAIGESLVVNKSLQRLYYTQESYLLKQMFM